MRSVSYLLLLSGMLGWTANSAQAQVQGSGTPQQVPVWTDSSTLGDSVITQDGNNHIGIGTVTPTAALTVVGAGGPFDDPGAARFDLFNATAGYGYLQHVLDDGAWQIATTNGNATRIIITPTGNVRIGTIVDTLGAKLAVVTDQQYAISGSSLAPAGNGVRGQGYTDTGIGVYGASESPLGHAGFFSGKLGFTNPASSGTTLCWNSTNDIAYCSSSLRYKTDVRPFSSGLDIVQRLRPIAFKWKQDGMRDVGLAAEDVAEVEPLLTFRNDKGEIEGVKYNQLSAVFVNAFVEQATQIQR